MVTSLQDSRMMSVALLLDTNKPMAEKCSLFQMFIKRMKYYLKHLRD